MINIIIWIRDTGCYNGLQTDADTNPRSGEAKCGGERAQERMLVSYVRLSTPFYIALPWNSRSGPEGLRSFTRTTTPTPPATPMVGFGTRQC
jgi:hypothetical protein